MNREQLEKILPAEKDVSNHKKYPTRKEMTEQGVAYGHNQCRQDCIDALLKAGVGLVPKSEELADAVYLVDYPNADKCHGRRKKQYMEYGVALRALMLSGGEK